MAAQVCGRPVTVEDVDAREAQFRATVPSASLPLAGTSEGRQLRRWLTQLIVTELVIAAEARRLGITADDAPALCAVLPDATARVEIGSVTAAVLSDPLARALYAYVVADVTVPDDEIAGYHTRNPMRFAVGTRGDVGWRNPETQPSLQQVRPAITAHLLAAARRRNFRNWLDMRSAALVVLASDYEHPGDPRQPDNVHRH